MTVTLRRRDAALLGIQSEVRPSSVPSLVAGSLEQRVDRGEDLLGAGTIHSGHRRPELGRLQDAGG
jgi:hypothetical protein